MARGYRRRIKAVQRRRVEMHEFSNHFASKAAAKVLLPLDLI
jgi:hypothetical protein